MKKIIVGAIILIILGGIVWGLVLFLDASDEKEPANERAGGLPQIVLPRVETSTLPLSNKIVIETPVGGVEMNNFYTTAKEINSQRDVLVEKENRFDVTYISSGGNFIIGVLEEPIEENRLVAERAFLSKLGISESQACRLTVWVGVPREVSAEYSGRNLGLSFCR